MPRGSLRQLVLQKVLHEAQWRSTAEEDMLDRRKREREIRDSSPCDGESWLTSEQAAGVLSRRQKDFEECKSGYASGGITDVVSNLLVKVQRDAVSENRNHNFCLGISYSRQT